MDHLGVELAASPVHDLLSGFKRREDRAVWPGRYQGIVGIGHGQDLRPQWQGRSLVREKILSFGGFVDSDQHGQHPAQRVAQRGEVLRSQRQMPGNGNPGVPAQADHLVQHRPTGFLFAEVVQASRVANVLDVFCDQPHLGGDASRIHRNPEGVVFPILILGDEMLEDKRQAVVGPAKFTASGLVVFMKGAGQPGGEHQDGAP